MKKLLTLFVIAGLSVACQQPESPYKTENLKVASSKEEQPEKLPMVDGDRIKNVILLIGDGTGFAQITAGQYAIVGPDGLLHMQTMPVTGIVSTHASDNLITDSAAGATAFSCGVKTYNGAIGMTPEGKVCKTILELAEENGLSTGLISTSSITHATPASFAAHVSERSMQEDIAADFLDSGVEVFLGGGVKWFSQKQRADSLDLLAQFEEAGYDILLDENELDQTSEDRLLGLFAEDGFERNGNEPSSRKMVQKALDILKTDEDGFFLMVEGSQIDWAGHANDTDYMVNEIRDFDEAVKIALDFAKEDGETLVLLTADHETGGLTLQSQQKEGEEVEIFWTSEKHTGTPVPLFAYGPQAVEFMGWRDNTYIGQKLTELLELGSLPEISD